MTYLSKFIFSFLLVFLFSIGLSCNASETDLNGIFTSAPPQISKQREQKKRDTMNLLDLQGKQGVEQVKKEHRQSLNMKLIGYGGRLGILITGTMLIQYCQTPEDEKFNVAGSLWNSMGGALLMSALLSDSLKNVGGLFCARFAPSWAAKGQDRYYELQGKYCTVKASLDSFLREALDKHFTAAYQAKERDDEDTCKRLYTIIETILKLPTENKKFSAENVQNKLQPALKSFPENLAKDIISFAKNLVLDSRFPKTEQEKRKTALLFLGPPGVGKTTLARLLAKTLDHPLYDLSLNGANEQKFKGGGSWDNPLKVGFFADALLKTNIKNPIILIDEADKTFNSEESDNQNNKTFFLQMLSDSMTHIYNYTLEAELNISDFIFIFTGNEPFNDPAFPRRLTTLIFPELSMDKRLKFAQSTLETQCRHYEVEITKARRDLVKTMAQKDINPGVAILEKVITDYVKSAAIDKIFKHKQQVYDIDSAFNKFGSANQEINTSSEPRS